MPTLPFYASITTRKLPRFFATRQEVVLPLRSNSKSNKVLPTLRFCNDKESIDAGSAGSIIRKQLFGASGTKLITICSN